MKLITRLIAENFTNGRNIKRNNENQHNTKSSWPHEGFCFICHTGLLLVLKMTVINKMRNEYHDRVEGGLRGVVCHLCTCASVRKIDGECNCNVHTASLSVSSSGESQLSKQWPEIVQTRVPLDWSSMTSRHVSSQTWTRPVFSHMKTSPILVYEHVFPEQTCPITNSSSVNPLLLFHMDTWSATVLSRIMLSSFTFNQRYNTWNLILLYMLSN